MAGRFSASEAALSGLVLVRRRPGAFAAWAVLRMLSLGVTLVLLVGMLGPDVGGLMALLRNPGNAAAMDATTFDMETFNVFRGFVQIIGIVLVAVTEAAIYRAMLSPGSDRYADLRLGGGEFRVGVVKFVYSIAMTIGFVVVWIPVAIAAAATAAATRDPGVVWQSVGVAGVVVVGAWALVGVRLSLAEVMSFDSGRLQFFDSWTLTRGRYGPMLGAYVLAWFVSIVIWLAVVVGVALTLGAAVALVPAIRPTRLDWMGIQPMLPALAIAWVAIGGVAAALAQVIMNAPAAYIYDRLTCRPAGPGPELQDVCAVDYPPGLAPSA